MKGGAFPTRVEVEWLDSMGDNGWRGRARAEREASVEQMRHWSCGYLIADEDEYVLLALSYRIAGEYVDEMVGDTLQIPREAMIATTLLQPGRKRA